MKFVLSVCLTLVYLTAGAWAGELKKPYFAATVPGDWAKRETATERPGGEDQQIIYTYTRAPDSAGRVRIETVTEVKAGPGEGTESRQLNILEPGFDLSRGFIGYMGSLEASLALSGDQAFPMQPDVIEIIRKNVQDVSKAFTYKGEEKIGGRTCDHYIYKIEMGDPNPSVTEFDVWLSEEVPFGIVRQISVSKDASGTVQSTSVENLIDSGSGGEVNSLLLSGTPNPKGGDAETTAGGAAEMAPDTLALSKAYQDGKIGLGVEVVEGSGGARLRITIQNKTRAPLAIVVPKGTTQLEADMPVNTLTIVADAEKKLVAPARGRSETVDVGQAGSRGAKEGKFKLSVYDGSPLFQGTVTMGPM